MILYQLWLKQFKAKSKMFATNRHYKLIERKNTVYTKIPFQEFKINQFHHIVLHFPSFIETIRRFFAPVHD